MESRGHYRCDHEECAVLDHVPEMTPAAASEWNSMHGDATLPFPAWFFRLAKAQHIDRMARRAESRHLSSDSRIERVIALPDDADPGHP
jgi:DNA-directed RNA polymerase specialized sigma24 family protein